jgi:predicted dinucleotide-binding enzyme
MHIAIIGAGNVGGALAHGLAGKGHALTFGVRDAARASAVAAATGAALATPADAAAWAEVVILALPWRAAEAAVKGLGDLTGKIVIDCINPIGMVDGVMGLTVGHTTSGGEIMAGWLPGARVVKTLNQVGAEVMANAAQMPARPVMFMAGDDPAAKTAVAGLLTDLGFAPLDAGMLIRARILEPLAMVWINQAVLRGMGRNWALSVTKGG